MIQNNSRQSDVSNLANVVNICDLNLEIDFETEYLLGLSQKDMKSIACFIKAKCNIITRIILF